eukprot:SAG11_NODE_37014_length_258_cov_17.943396_1_plen_85_part_11
MTTMVGCLRHFRPARANLGAMGVCITLLAMIALSLRYSSESRVPVGNQARRIKTMVGCLRHFRPARANLGAMGVCITLLAMIALS